MEKKKNLLEEKLRRMIREEYSRAHKKQIGNELYGAMRDIKQCFDSLNNGRDFHPEEIDNIISALEKVKATAQKSDSGTMPIDKNYR